MIITFLVVFAALLGGGYLLIMHLRKRRIAERQRLSEVAKGFDLKPAARKSAPADALADGTGEEPAPDEAPPPKKVVPMSKEWVNLVERLKTQALALFASANEASKLDSECDNLQSAIKRRRERLDWEAVLPTSSKLEAIKVAIETNQDTPRSLRKAEDGYAQTAPAATIAAQKAKADWEALTGTLRHVDLDDHSSMPDEVLPVVLAAAKIRNWAKGMVEKTSESAAKRTLPQARPKGPSVERIQDSLEELMRKLVDTLQYRDDNICAPHTECSTLVTAADSFEEQTIREPNKPTAEDVGRYLTELEEWAVNRLKAQRAAYAALKRYVPNRAVYAKMLIDLKRSVDGLVYVVGTSVDPEAESLVSAAQRMFKEIDSRFHKVAGDVDSWQTRSYDRSEPVFATTGEEDEEIKVMRQLARTVAFAVAQRNVAAVKYANAQHKLRPSQAYEPRVPDELDFDKLALGFREYLDLQARNAADNAQIDAEIEVIFNALEARNAKIKQSAELLSSKAKAAAKKIDDDSADEFRVVTAFGSRLCALHGVS